MAATGEWCRFKIKTLRRRELPAKNTQNCVSFSFECNLILFLSIHSSATPVYSVQTESPGKVNLISIVAWRGRGVALENVLIAEAWGVNRLSGEKILRSLKRRRLLFSLPKGCLPQAYRLHEHKQSRCRQFARVNPYWRSLVTTPLIVPWPTNRSK